MPYTNPRKRGNCHQNRKASLLNAVMKGDPNEVRRLLEKKNLNVNMQSKNGNTSLILALKNLDEATIAVLLGFHANIETKNKFGESALQMAMKLGLSNKTIVEMFLKALKKEYHNNGKKLASKLISIQCPLYISVLLNNAETTKIILKKYHAVDDKDLHTFQTALHSACYVQDYESIKLLIDSGANVNAMDYYGNIPIYYYRSFDDSDEELDMLKMFMKQNTAWTLFSSSGFVQLEWALRFGKRKVLQMLLRSNIDWTVTNEYGNTPLYHLICNEILLHNQDILEDLWDKQINTNAADSWGTSELFEASSHGISKLVEIFLDKGADPNLQNTNGMVSLQVVSKLQGNYEKQSELKKIFVLLLERGADPQLMYICRHRYKTVYDIMVEYQSFALKEPALGQLAINESHGIPITEHVRSTINSHHWLQNQLSLSQTQLEKFKQTTVYNLTTLYQLLSASDKTLLMLARDKEFFEKWKSEWINSIDYYENSYYAHTFQTKLEKTLELVSRRKDVATLVCNVMNIYYESYPAIVDKITFYVLF